MLLSVSEAVQRLFGVEGKCLRNKANSFIRNKTVPVSMVKKSGFSDPDLDARGKVHIFENALAPLFNAFILDAFLNETKSVKKTMTEKEGRKKYTEVIRQVIYTAHANEYCNVDTGAVSIFLQELGNKEFNLNIDRLTSPFKNDSLPQLEENALNLGLLRLTLLNNHLDMSEPEEMLLALLDQDLEKAYQVTLHHMPLLHHKSQSIRFIAAHVQKEYLEGQKFNQLLSLLPD